MFEHLDDPSPPEPSARTLGAVLARAAHLRRRRVVSAMGAVAVGALSLGVVIGAVASGPTTSQTFAAFDSQTGLLALGTPVPSTDLASVVFVGDLRGFALAVHSTQTVLAVSTDGGGSWTVADPSLPMSFPAQFEFSDAVHGYLWGGPPSSTGIVPLWITANGGRTWTRAGVGPVVSDVSAIGPDVWAVVGTCPISSSAGASCPVLVEISTDNGQTWAQPGAAPPLREDSEVSVSDENIEMARITPSRAYVLSFASRAPAPAAAGSLTYTADGGRTWGSRADPCPSYFDFGEQIAASGTEDLWMVCASQASAGSQAKALYRSSDGGEHWSLAAAANAPVLTGGRVLPSGGGLSSEGYVTPYSLAHENLAVLTTKDAWLFPDRSGVFETTDGGHTWGVVAGLDKSGLVDGGSGNVVFVDATHGWVCEAASGLWRTTNGKDWERLGP
ncbi:MAG TPA: sialidase family protein [Acidimicrobiales bacterium]|nr:sialidase family protein [Acidimicrobiales bacterium]